MAPKNKVRNTELDKTNWEHLEKKGFTAQQLEKFIKKVPQQELKNIPRSPKYYQTLQKLRSVIMYG